jgi:hypothetical protein
MEDESNCDEDIVAVTEPLGGIVIVDLFLERERPEVDKRRARNGVVAREECLVPFMRMGTSALMIILAPQGYSSEDHVLG